MYYQPTCVRWLLLSLAGLSTAFFNNPQRPTELEMQRDVARVNAVSAYTRGRAILRHYAEPLDSAAPVAQTFLKAWIFSPTERYSSVIAALSLNRG